MGKCGQIGVLAVIATLLGGGVSRAEISHSDALRQIKNDCQLLRSRASFTISSRCDFTVTGLLQSNRDGRPGVAITAYSAGIVYDITFTAIYTVNNGSIGYFLDVRKDKFEGISGLSKWMVEHAADAMAAERPR